MARRAPRTEYEKMLERMEDLEDALEMRTIEAKVGEHEDLPAELVNRMLGGEHPLRV